MKSAVLATENTKASKVRLGDVCRVAAGQGAPQGDALYCDVGVPFVKAGDLQRLLEGCPESSIQNVPQTTIDKCRLKIQPSDSVLFAKSGMSCMKGLVYRLKSECCVVSHLAVVTPTEAVIGSYLEYYFQFKKPNRLVKDPAYPSISLADIASIELSIPPLSEQKRIAAELDLITEMIRNREAQLARLDTLVKSKFEEMFGGGFEMRSFGEICEFLRNGANIRQDKLKIGVPITRIETLSKGVFNKDRLGYASIMDAKEYSNHIMREGDLLISHINSFEYVGRTVQYRGEVKGDIIHGMNLLRARLLPNHDPTYVEFYLTSDTAQKYFRSVTKKAVNQASMAISDLRRLQIPLPPLAIQKEFAAVVEEVDKSKAAIKKTIENLKTLYKARLQEYFA